MKKIKVLTKNVKIQKLKFQSDILKFGQKRLKLG